MGHFEAKSLVFKTDLGLNPNSPLVLSPMTQLKILESTGSAKATG